MIDNLGFIGGGRITRIFLDGMLSKGRLPKSIFVAEVDEKAIELLKKYPLAAVDKNPDRALKQKYVFIALHPPAVKNLLDDFRKGIGKDSIIISLAPKLTAEWFRKNLGDQARIARCIPNAPSAINKGYNPVFFSSNVPENEKSNLMEFFGLFGKTVITAEKNLEAYAVLTAMGPTYLWFQLYELQNIIRTFGLEEEELNQGIYEMVTGSLDTMFSGLSCSEVLDLVPVRPLGNYEMQIKEMYNTALGQVYQKIKPE